MSTTREQHLAWCKARALELIDAGDISGAIASMLSDLTKWDRPLYDASVLQLMASDVMLFRKTAPDVRNWIDGFL